MTTKYKRMDQAERDEVLAGLSAGKKAPEIALALGRHKGTVSREIARNGGALLYRPSAAGKRAVRAASSRKKGKRRLFSEGRLRRAVVRMVRRRLSPDQVSKRLAMDYPDDMTMRISPEAVYQYIYVLPRGALRDGLVKGLRHERANRRTKRGAAGETRGKIAEMLSIEERPAEVAERSVPGHWEGDLVVGARNATAVATLVERVTRYTLVIRLPHGKDAESVRKAMARAVSRLPARLRKSMTYDQGKEMAEHKAFAKAAGMTVYFAHPHSPWERGTNENTNGLVRQYFPKGTDFSRVSAREIRKCQDGLNGRPRKILNYFTPNEAIGELMKRRAKS